MIYLVSKQTELFDSNIYQRMSIEEALKEINSWDIIQVDSETTGRDPHICDILCFQFGNDKADKQIVVDCKSYSITLFKDILENHLLIGQNLKFDLQFLYKYKIVPLNVYDTMIVEQLLYLGFPPAGKPGGISYSLKAIADRRLGIDIDKTVRGEIIWRGLDSSVIQYAAYDVYYLEKIRDLQLIDCEKKGCKIGAQLENQFVPTIAYMEWCGIKLDETKWKAKMDKDKENLDKAKKALDKFIIDYYNIHKNASTSFTVQEWFPYKEISENGDILNIDLPIGWKSLYKTRIKEEETLYGTYIYHELLMSHTYPFITINLQGSLFDGFDTEPKCIINWSSSRQVIEIAKVLGFNTEVKDKKTGESKDSVLEKALSIQKGINDEFLDLYFKYQEYAKVVSSFGQGHLNAVNPLTGRIHTTFKQLGASSGRLSCGSTQANEDLAKFKKIKASECTYPNLQQLPADEETRAAFVAPEGYKFISADFSSEESRLAADIYQDKEFYKEFTERSGDKMYVTYYSNIV